MASCSFWVPCYTCSVACLYMALSTSGTSMGSLCLLGVTFSPPSISAPVTLKCFRFPRCTKLFLDFMPLFMVFLLPAFFCSPAGHILRLLQTQSWLLCTRLSPYRLAAQHIGVKWFVSVPGFQGQLVTTKYLEA